jgi:D-alanyl-D-alanine carboxypeptidase/D-alanyl-D-alanine-endopeptidase (penicillin-binding protein 4)
LQDSDNLIAENLLLMVAKERLGLFSTKAIIEVLRKDWAAAPDEWVWVDGSGLSRYNLVTTRNLIWLLQLLFQEMGPQKIQQYFPRAGVSGTLKRSYGSNQLPVVYAKTGTLRNNHNLSGYVLDSQGQWYAFSILVNQHIRSTTAVGEGIQTLLEFLTRRF